jgi:hypothetical protein
VFLQPLAEDSIHAALPAFAGRFKGVRNVNIEADRCRFFRCGPRRSPVHGFFCCVPEIFPGDNLIANFRGCLGEKSSVNSGASSRTVQELDNPLFFASIGISHRNNAAGGAAKF